MPSNPPDPRHELRAHIRSSARWAAYGDALGFVTELADAEQVRRRAGRYPVDETVPWRRRVGGRGGPTVDLPAGCVSDDTQLRLAVSRCIGPGGFDPDAFAAVELTVWPSYALGAGRGSKAAAAHLARRDASWSTNFFDTPGARYVDGGGNGAAMRIQPHVWASRPRRATDDLLIEVYRDAVATHGHPRGLLGAGLHALALRQALNSQVVPGPDDWRRDLADLAATAELISADPDLGGLWLGMWRQRTGRELGDVVRETVAEIAADIDLLADIVDDEVEGAYRSAVEALQAFRPDQRGSGTKTALLASWLAWRGARNAEGAVRTAANRLGTDTDSIATMAGALLGAVGAAPPSGTVVDQVYVELEADRNWALALGGAVPSFPHPDLRRWQAPRTQSDALLVDADRDGRLAIAGLGPVETVDDEPVVHRANDAVAWQWVDLWFGQRVLVKRRERPSALPGSMSVHPTDTYLAPSLLDHPDGTSRAPAADGRAALTGRDRIDDGVPRTAPQVVRPTLHQLTDEAIASDFDPEVIGRHVLQLSDASDDGIERTALYVAIIAKARLTRRDRGRRAGGRPPGSTSVPGDHRA